MRHLYVQIQHTDTDVVTGLTNENKQTYTRTKEDKIRD